MAHAPDGTRSRQPVRALAVLASGGSYSPVLVTSNNVSDYGVKKAVENLSVLKKLYPRVFSALSAC
jgi:hypothetical protein